MTIAPFGWKDGPTGGTPINSVNLELMLQAAGAYTDDLGEQVSPQRTPIADDYQALTTDRVIGVVDTSNPVAVTLADPSTLLPGQMVLVKDESGGAGTNPITVNGQIDGLSSIPIAQNYGVLWVMSTGTTYAGIIMPPVPNPVTPPVIS